MEKKEEKIFRDIVKILEQDVPQEALAEGNPTPEQEAIALIKQELEKAREEGRREVYEAIVFDENIPHDITTFVAANLWKNMRDKAKEELSKLNK